jgi:hypothetical protein
MSEVLDALVGRLQNGELAEGSAAHELGLKQLRVGFAREGA